MAAIARNELLTTLSPKDANELMGLNGLFRVFIDMPTDWVTQYLGLINKTRKLPSNEIQSKVRSLIELYSLKFDQIMQTRLTGAFIGDESRPEFNLAIPDGNSNLAYRFESKRERSPMLCTGSLTIDDPEIRNLALQDKTLARLIYLPLQAVTEYADYYLIIGNIPDDLNEELLALMHEVNYVLYSSTQH